MNASHTGTHRAISSLRVAGFLIGGAIACLIALGTHVYVMSALKVSAHVLSIRLERATGCDEYQRIMDAAGQGAHSVVDAYIHVCIEAPGSAAARRGYFLMLDLE